MPIVELNINVKYVKYPLFYNSFLTFLHIKFRFKNKETRDVVVSLIQSLQNVDILSPKGKITPNKHTDTKGAKEHLPLTEEEWKLILGTSNSCIQFQKGDYIIKEGCTYKSLFQTVSGTFDVVKETRNKGNEVIGSVSDGEVLGEINFFTQNAASASIIVTSDSAEVYLIDKEYLWSLMEKHPNVVLRFYYHLCNIVGSRLMKHT